MDQNVIYFDHNATSPLSPAAREAWICASQRHIGNPSSPHRVGARAEVALTLARERAAALFGCSEFDLVWTSGATEANNTLFHSVSRSAPNGEVWVSAIEHPSVIAPARHWFGRNFRLLPVTREGVLDLNNFIEQIAKRCPALVVLMAANNETGVLQPWREVLEICHSHGVRFACDAVQWVGKQISMGLGDCDFLTTSAHKFGGPVGIGLMKVSGTIQPLIIGGPQEEGRRAGTENIPSALSMVAALSEREEQIREGQTSKRLQWRDEFISDLEQALPGIEIIGKQSPRLWNTVSALMPETADCRRRWVVQLDKLGFAVSTGSACSSGKEAASHVLTAMGYNPSEAGRMLRFSSGWETSKEDWRKLLNGIKEAFAQVQRC